jgi:thiamine kinase-like enzyme
MIQELNGALSPLSEKKDVFDSIKAELWEALAGQPQTLSWIHGDYWPGNILISQDDLSVTGILDWEAALPDDLPLLDIANLLISTRIILQRKELGDVIIELLRGDALLPREQYLLDESVSGLSGDRIEIRTMLLLHWLRHIGSNLDKSNRFAKNKLWIARNVEAVLEYLRHNRQ